MNRALLHVVLASTPAATDEVDADQVDAGGGAADAAEAAEASLAIVPFVEQPSSEPPELDLAALLHGVQALPLSWRAREAVDKAGRVVYSGAAHRSEHHVQHARDVRERLLAERREAAEKGARAGMTKLWNEKIVRFGDLVADKDGEDDDGAARHHANAYQPHAILANSWMNVNKFRGKRDGIHGAPGLMSMSSVVASALGMVQTSWLEDTIDSVLQSDTVLMLQRFFDASPKRLQFGSLQDRIQPHARYCLFNKDKMQWDIVNFAEFRSNTGMKFARFGILDVFSQTCYVQWQRGDQKIDGVEVLVKPMVLQRGSAACIHAAVEQAIPAFSELRLAYLCKRVGLVIVNSRPDACSANRRKLAFDQHQRAGLDNCLELPGECASHQAHRVVASREPDVRGGLDALACCGAHVAIQQRCLKVLWDIALEDMETGWTFTTPNSRDVARNRIIVKHTLLRHRTGGFDDIAADEYVKADVAAQQVLNILGGSWDMPRLAHPCSGCCKTKEEAATKVMACLVSAGVSFNNEVRRPSMDDWGSCGQAAGVATFGCACHGILPRMCERVFPTYHVLPNDVDTAEESAIARAKLQKKSEQGEVLHVECWVEGIASCLRLEWGSH